MSLTGREDGYTRPGIHFLWLMIEGIINRSIYLIDLEGKKPIFKARRGCTSLVRHGKNMWGLERQSLQLHYWLIAPMHDVWLVFYHWDYFPYSPLPHEFWNESTLPLAPHYQNKHTEDHSQNAELEPEFHFQYGKIKLFSCARFSEHVSPCCPLISEK